MYQYWYAIIGTCTEYMKRWTSEVFYDSCKISIGFNCDWDRLSPCITLFFFLTIKHLKVMNCQIKYKKMKEVKFYNYKRAREVWNHCYLTRILYFLDCYSIFDVQILSKHKKRNIKLKFLSLNCVLVPLTKRLFMACTC